MRGDLLRDSGDWAGAREAYREHLAEDPQDFAIWVQLGHAAKETRAFDDSLDAYLGAYAIDPGDGDLLLNLGHLRKRGGDLVGAAYFYLLSERAGDNPHAAVELIDPALAGAMAGARELLERHPHPDAATLRGLLSERAPHVPAAAGAARPISAGDVRRTLLSRYPAFAAGRVAATFTGEGEPVDLFCERLGEAEVARMLALDELRLAEPGVRPAPLVVEAHPDTGARVDRSIALLGDPTADGPHRALARLELLRRDGEGLAMLAAALASDSERPAPDIVAAAGLLPQGRAVPPSGEAFPAGGILDRYRAMQRDIAARLALDHGATGTVTGGPTISVLMPVYRSPVVFLERAIQSVLRQTYANWQLVIVDDHSGRPALTELLGRYAAAEPRITLATLDRNGGISAASNRGLALAKGSWVALLDHDDMLTSDALARLAETIGRDPELDWIYSDECKIGSEDQPDELLTKPDWSPTLLTSVMYTGHLSTYRTALVRRLGGFRTPYDLSQDYDLALRVAEQEPRVHHLREVLYGWRMIAGSAARGEKPEARRTNIAALQAAMDRRGWAGLAEALPASNRARAALATTGPLVSIIIPSDNVDHILSATMSIVALTSYDDFEVVVVTRSAIADECHRALTGERVRFVTFDEPYNFSAKCNAGAAAARGEVLVFHNDDVLVITPDWLQALLEPIGRGSVGAVGPKLLYEDGRIQHAGMATGTRRLVGTAFHMFPRHSHAHFNLAQSTREVSLLCGACIAVPRPAFEAIGGWDAVNTPIAHSDVDFCLRLGEAGYSCIYTPHAELTHVGHVSIGASEPRIGGSAVGPADVFLLRRFPQAIAEDPFFPPAMRDLLDTGSTAPFAIHPPTGAPGPGTGPSVLIVSHDLTQSGAPRVVADMARVLIAAGCFVTVVAPGDGPMRARLQAAGATVIVDALALSDHDSFRDIAAAFDKVVVNTIVGWPAVRQLAGADVYWYVHEAAFVDELAAREPELVATLRDAPHLLAVSRRTQAFLAKHGAAAELLETGIDDPGVVAPSLPGQTVRIGVFGSFEARKGQDLAAAAFAAMPERARARARLEFHGRDHDPALLAREKARWQNENGIHFMGEAVGPAYWTALAATDIVVVPSRDDPLPLVASDALALGRTLVLSDAVGTCDYVEDGRSAFVVPSEDVAALSDLLARLVSDTNLRLSVREGARAVFEARFGADAFARRLLDRLGIAEAGGVEAP